MYAGETVELQLGVAWIARARPAIRRRDPGPRVVGRAMDGLVAGDLDPRPLISHRLPLGEAASGYEVFDRREATKVVLDPWA